MKQTTEPNNLTVSKQTADELLLCEDCARKERMIWDRDRTKIGKCDYCDVVDIVARSLSKQTALEGIIK